VTAIYEAKYVYTLAKSNDTTLSGKTVSISTKGQNKWMKGIYEIQGKTQIYN